MTQWKEAGSLAARRGIRCGYWKARSLDSALRAWGPPSSVQSSLLDLVSSFSFKSSRADSPVYRQIDYLPRRTVSCCRGHRAGWMEYGLSAFLALLLLESLCTSTSLVFERHPHPPPHTPIASLAESMTKTLCLSTARDSSFEF